MSQEKLSLKIVCGWNDLIECEDQAFVSRVLAEYYMITPSEQLESNRIEDLEYELKERQGRIDYWVNQHTEGEKKVKELQERIEKLEKIEAMFNEKEKED